MPITRLKVKALKVPQRISAAEGDVEEEVPKEDTPSEQEPTEEKSRSAEIFDFVMAFLALKQKPTDQEFHALAELVGISHEEFEAVTYQALALVLEKEAAEGTLEDLADTLQEHLEADDEEADEAEPEEVLEDPEEASEDESKEGPTVGESDSSDDELVDEEDGELELEEKEEDAVDAALDTFPAKIVEASDPIGRSAENDGVPDEELQGIPNPLKEASEHDGAPDEELLDDPTQVTL